MTRISEIGSRVLGDTPNGLLVRQNLRSWQDLLKNILKSGLWLLNFFDKICSKTPRGEPGKNYKQTHKWIICVSPVLSMTCSTTQIFEINLISLDSNLGLVRDISIMFTAWNIGLIYKAKYKYCWIFWSLVKICQARNELSSRM